MWPQALKHSASVLEFVQAVDAGDAEATMAPTASEGEVRKRDLHRSDEDGARFIYPGEVIPLHCSATEAPPSLLWTLAIGVLAAFGMRRRRPTDAPDSET